MKMVAMQQLLRGYNIFVTNQFCVYQVYIQAKYERDTYNIS